MKWEIFFIEVHKILTNWYECMFINLEIDDDLENYNHNKVIRKLWRNLPRTFSPILENRGLLQDDYDKWDTLYVHAVHIYTIYLIERRVESFLKLAKKMFVVIINIEYSSRV